MRGKYVNIFTRIVEEAREKDIRLGTQAARTWFRKKGNNIKNATPERMFSEKDSATTTRILPGYMYMFLYNAKWKDELPYWDKFPLIFPLEKYKDGFLGINLHYLDKRTRARLMDTLYEVLSNDKYDERTKLMINYQILKGLAKKGIIKAIIKRYLYSHVESRFIKIPANEWDIALFLPTARFQKASEQEVWADSKRIMAGEE